MNLSMVTVCYNAQNCIERTMQSVLNQSIPVFEYIIIDGGSGDNTMEIVKSYEEKFISAGVRFSYVSEKDNGISDAFNKGIRKATGDLVGLINADDEMASDTNEVLQTKFMQRKADIYYGNCKWVEPQNHLEYTSVPKQTDDRKMDGMLYEMLVIHPATFVTKEAYDKAGLFDETYRYCMDQELLYRMVKHDMKFCYVNHVLTKFKAGGVSDSNARKVLEEACRIPRLYHESEVKIKMNFYKKLVRNRLARTVKNLGIYNLIKK